MYRGSPAEDYVAARGLERAAETFGLGYVGSALLGHDRYTGYLAIPYLRPAGGEDGVATVRYRCIADACVKDDRGAYLSTQGLKERHGSCKKYMTVPSDVPRLFNTAALISPSPFLVVVEGEFDAMSWWLSGVPAVGAPGTTWAKYWGPVLGGYEAVYLIAEDGPGRIFMDSIAATAANARVIRMKDDRDSNLVFQTHGAEALRKRIGL
ncbi:topoisomerase [Streptomyces sp. NPDC087850]|uniref:topoisomerase n=1 Tax=Streptomyces sp. NPDC087850 TaxID=3365809 RepID=UPI0038171965